MDTGYVMAGGKVARKVIGGVLAAVVAGGPLSVLITYYVSKLFAGDPPAVQAAWDSLITTAIVAGAGGLGAFLTAPDKADVPVRADAPHPGGIP